MLTELILTNTSWLLVLYKLLLPCKHHKFAGPIVWLLRSTGSLVCLHIYMPSGTKQAMCTFILPCPRYNPQEVGKAAALLESGAVLGRRFQPHESHLPFLLQLKVGCTPAKQEHDSSICQCYSSVGQHARWCKPALPCLAAVLCCLYLSRMQLRMTTVTRPRQQVVCKKNKKPATGPRRRWTLT